MNRERTLVMIKPDAVERNLVGPIIKHFEKSGINIRAIKMMKLDVATAQQLYEEHRGKPFYDSLIEYMTSNAIVAMIVEGVDSIKRVRELIGSTNPIDACEGTIRRMYAISKQKNSIHASDSRHKAFRELECLFHSDLSLRSRAA